MPLDPKTADLMLTDFSAWEKTLDDNQRQQLETTFKYEPDRAAAQKRFAAVASVAAYTNKDVQEVSNRFEDYYMHAFARDEQVGFGLKGGVKDINEFQKLLAERAGVNKAKADTFKNASQAAVNSALRGSSSLNDFAAWQLENEHLPEAFSDEAYKVWDKTFTDIDNELGKDGRAAASRAFRAMRAMTGVAEESDAWINEAKRDLIELRMRSPKAYDLALASVQLMAQDTGKVEKGVMQGIGESFGRRMSDLAASALYVKPLIEMSQDASEAMVKAGITNAENPERLAAQIRARREVENDIVEISQGVIDPIEKTREGWAGYAEDAAYFIASSVPYRIAAMIPGGQTAIVGSFVSGNYNTFRRSGWEGASAAVAAVSSGVFEGAVEDASRIVLKIPGVAGLFNKFGVKPGSSWATQFFLRSVAQGGTEVVEEVIQEATAPFVQELANAISPSIPDTPEGKHLSDVMGKFFEAENFAPLLLSILPLGMIGAGMSTSQDMQYLKDIQSFFGDDAASEIMAEADFAKRDAMIREKFKAMPAEEFLKKARGVTQENIKQFEESSKLIQEAENSRMIPRLRRDAKGWAIEDNETGAVTRVSTREQAVSMVFGHLDEQEQRKAQAAAQLWDELYEKGGMGAEVLRAEASDMDTKKQATRSPEDAEQVKRGVETYAKLHGLTTEEAQKIIFTVMGFNRTETIEGVRSAVSSVFGRGMNVSTVLHEGFHGRWRAGLESGVFTHEQGIRWVRLAEEATGIDFLPSKKDEDITAEVLDEAIVDVSVSNEVGRRKDGRSFSAGLIARGMASLARGERNTQLGTTKDERAYSRDAGTFATWLKSWKEFWGVVMQKGKALRKAKAEGKLGEDYEAFLDKLMNTSMQARHEAGAAQEAIDIAREGDSYSLRPTNVIAKEKGIPSTITPEVAAKFKDRPIVPGMADLLAASATVRNVDIHGGPGYPVEKFDPEDPEKITAVWASMRKGVQTILLNMIKGNAIWQDENGRHWALFSPFTMKQVTHQSNAQTPLVYVSKINKMAMRGAISNDHVVDISNHIRSIVPGAANMPNLGTMEAEAFFGKASFETRASIMVELTTARSINLGAPSPDSILTETRDPQYHGVLKNSIISLILIDVDRLATKDKDGNWILRKDLSAEEIGADPHPSYDTVIPGRILAHFEHPIPFNVATPLMVQTMKTASPTSRPEFLLSRMPPNAGIKFQPLTSEIVEKINEVQKINSLFPEQKAATLPQIKMMVDAVNGNWTTYTQGASTKGLTEFTNAIDRSPAKESLTPYTSDEVNDMVEDGTMTVHQLGDQDVWFGIKKGEGGAKELVSVVNNTGIPGTLNVIMAKALELGANKLDAYAVSVPGMPNGLLPTLYERHGWKQDSRSEFDRQYLLERIEEEKLEAFKDRMVKKYKDEKGKVEDPEVFKKRITEKYKKEKLKGESSEVFKDRIAKKYKGEKIKAENSTEFRDRIAEKYISERFKEEAPEAFEERLAQKDAALQMYWEEQGWDGQAMPDMVFMSHDGIRTDRIGNEDRASLVEAKIESIGAASGEADGTIRGRGLGEVGAESDGGGVVESSDPNRGVLPRGADTIVRPLEKVTDTQLQAIGITRAEFNSFKENASSLTSYSLKVIPPGSAAERFANASYSLSKADQLKKKIGKMSAAQMRKALNAATLIPDDAMINLLGKFPEYLNPVIDSIVAKRKQLIEGKLTMRDLGKAYFMTVASIGASAIDVQTIREKAAERGMPFNPDDLFLSRGAKGQAQIRPEEMAAWWLGTPQGQTALNNLEAGNFDPADWEDGLLFRDTFGRNDLRSKVSKKGVVSAGAMGPPKKNQFNFTNMKEALDAINASKGDPDLLEAAVLRINGIAEGKKGFISHMLGFGEWATIDAVEINLWLTGKGDTTRASDKHKEIVGIAKRASGTKAVNRVLFDRIRAGIKSLRDKAEGADQIPEEVSAHVIHHWIWDRAKGIETTHEGMYYAMTSYSLAPKSYSLAPRSLVESADTVLAAQMRKPKFRETFYDLARAKMARLRKQANMKPQEASVDRSAEIQAEIEAARIDYQADIDQLRQDRDFELAGAQQEKSSKLSKEQIRRDFDGKISQRQKEWIRQKSEMDAKLAANDAKIDRSAANTERDRQMMALRTLDAILSAFPSNIRGTVGGFVKLASYSTDEAREAEIMRRLDKLDEVVEKSAKKHYGEQIDKLFKKAAPKRDAGKKPIGKLGSQVQELFDLAETFTKLTEAQVSAERIVIAEEMQKNERNPVKLADLLEREQMLDLFGAIYERTSAEMESATQWLAGAYEQGRNIWRAVVEARLEDIKEERAEAKDDIGKEGLDSEQQAAIEQAKTITGKTKAYSLSFMSFEQVMHSALGRSSKLAKSFVSRARRATFQRTDALRNKRKAFRSQMAAIFGTTQQTQWQQRLFELSQISDKSALTITKMEGANTQTVEVPAEIIERILNGQAQAKAYKLDTLTLDALANAWFDNEALPAKNKKKNLSYEVTTGGVSTPTKLSQLQAVHLSMMAKQPGYTENLAGHGWNNDAMADIEKKLTPEAKAIRDFLAEEYRTGYDSLNAVYSRMYGLNLPRLTNYAPGTFEAMNAMGQDIDPYGQGLLSEGGFKAGMLKTRQKHNAKPRLEDALSVYWGHINSTEHFKAFGEFARDIRSVLNHADVRGSITAKGGKSLLESVQNWITAFERNGVESRGTSSAFNEFIRRRQSAQAYLSLAYQVGTLMKQSTAALGSLLNMGPMDGAKQLTKLLTGQLDLGASYRSEAIQRRLDAGYSPEVQQAMAGMMAEKPNWGSPIVQRGMEIIGMVDAMFTTVSHAMAYDYHLQQAKVAKLNDTQAVTFATREAEDTVARTSQPSEMMDRSLVELGMQPMAKFLFMFATEARQKAAIAWEAYAPSSGLSKGERASRLILLHIVFPLIIQTITSAWRDARDDGEDDEIFDEKNWQAGDYAKAIILGPLLGIPIIGGGLNAAMTGIFGGHFFANDPNQPLNQAAGGAVDIMEAITEQDLDSGLKGAKALIRASALIVGGEKAAAIGAGVNVLSDAYRIFDNITE